MAYDKQTWNNNDPATPLSASRLNFIETGVDAAHETLDALNANVASVLNGSYSFTKVQITDNGDAILEMRDNSATADHKRFLIITESGVTRLLAFSDSGLIGQTFATLNHATGEVSFPASTNMSFGGTKLSTLLAEPSSAGTSLTLTSSYQSSRGASYIVDRKRAYLEGGAEVQDTGNTTLTTMPNGARPLNIRFFSVAVWDNSNGAWGTGTIQVNPEGTIQRIGNISTPGAGSAAYAALDIIELSQIQYRTL